MAFIHKCQTNVCVHAKNDAKMPMWTKVGYLYRIKQFFVSKIGRNLVFHIFLYYKHIKTKSYNYNIVILLVYNLAFFLFLHQFPLVKKVINNFIHIKILWKMWKTPFNNLINKVDNVEK